MDDLIADVDRLMATRADTREWQAWNDMRPQLPDYFHIVSEVRVPNPGVIPVLSEALPGGEDSSILRLDLTMSQRSGDWPQIHVWRHASFTRPIHAPYTKVEVTHAGTVIASLEARDVH